MRRKQTVALLLVSALLVGTVGFINPAQVHAEGEANTFTLTVPADTNITTSGWNTIGNVEISNYDVDASHKVSVTIDGGATGRTLKNTSDTSKTVGYEIKTGTSSSEAVAFGDAIYFTTAGTQSIGADVADFSNAEAGIYEDTINFTASIATDDQCFAKGTEITMADGSLKKIEDIEVGDCVLTFNHESGVYEGQKVYLAYQGDYEKAAFTLHFTNGTTLSIVGMHDLFEKESMKYVTVSQGNATQFIGKYFYNATAQRFEELFSVTYETEKTEFYSIYTEYNANAIANGMLSVPDDFDEILNIYKFNEDLTADAEQLQKDIEQYGIYEYPADASYSKQEYDAYGLRYVYIIIGKGLLTWDNFVSRRDEFLADR